MKNYRKHIFVCGVVLITGILITGCASNAAKTSSDSQAEPALLKIIDQDGKETGVSMKDLKALPITTITIDFKVQGGPTLKSVLEKAGISDYKKVVIHGKDGTECTLSKEQVDSKTVLDFSNRDTVKLATTYIKKAKWAKDVDKITVK